MKSLKIVGFLGLCAVFAVCRAQNTEEDVVTEQSSTTEEVKKKTPNEINLEKKLASKFVVNGNWLIDFDKAREKAKKENKPIVAYFTRSYAP